MEFFPFASKLNDCDWELVTQHNLLKLIEYHT